MAESATLKLPHSEEAGETSISGVSNKLKGCVQPVTSLVQSEREQMFELLKAYFANTSVERFEEDLKEKDWVILMREEQAGTIQGFSTLMQTTEDFDGELVSAIYSGDTIIHQDYWGTTVLPKLWSQHVFKLAAESPQQKTYWFLISGGYKTYRFLTVFFREFYPSYKNVTPNKIKELMNDLGQSKYGEEYDETRGVVRFKELSPLRAGIAEITPSRLKDLHVAFFQKVNPGHCLGEELACITEISPQNVTAAGKRMLGRLE
jgi:hypothetical protein